MKKTNDTNRKPTTTPDPRALTERELAATSGAGQLGRPKYEDMKIHDIVL